MDNINELSIIDLSKSFDGVEVLSHINLDVEKGDIYGILGLSGAGKSTLVRCINGLEDYDFGRIEFEGRVLSTSKEKIKLSDRRKIQMIFQQFNLLEQKNVYDNVKLALDLDREHKYSKEEKRSLVLEALERVSLSDKIKSYPSQLSGGQKQRVAIARSLVLKPSILLSDEATSALDPQTTESILELLKKLNSELGLTILMISHQMNVIETICNKVAIISEGKIIENGKFKDVFLAPKNEKTKAILYANNVHTDLDEKKLFRIIFDGNADEPLLSNIILDLHILVNVVYADTKINNGKIYGQMLIKAPKGDDLEKLKYYLDNKHFAYQEVEND